MTMFPIKVFRPAVSALRTLRRQQIAIAKTPFAQRVLAERIRHRLGKVRPLTGNIDPTLIATLPVGNIKQKLGDIGCDPFSVAATVFKLPLV